MELVEKILAKELSNAFKKSGYNEEVNVQICSLENLGDFQCCEPLMLAKKYHKSPLQIANEVVSNLEKLNLIGNVSVAAPGYINIFLNDDALAKYLVDYLNHVDEIIKEHGEKKNVVVDYGGANVAKPLHVGHLRTAIIGESIKRLCSYLGDNTLGDVHLGDWGLQMGMVICEIKRMQPDLVYFDENYLGNYPDYSPVTLDELSILYPKASSRAKSDENAMEEAKQATFELQHGRRGYLALWKNILELSKRDLKKNYDNLNVSFDLWLGESDSRKYYEEVVEYTKNSGYAKLSQGAWIVDVSEENDKKEVPPFILLKSDGSVLYSTTDLATIVQRERENNADKIIYVVDNRQEMHFTQVFRCVNKIKILKKPIELCFVGFGTMNGKDGKPYKTRDGGVMQLSVLIEDVKTKALEKLKQSKQDDCSDEEMENISSVIALAALKFADLSIYRTKDYIFDVDKFTSFEGKTGPYILYTVTRAKSILNKVKDFSSNVDFELFGEDRKLALILIQFHKEIISAYKSLSPNLICDYVYKLANAFNSFYAKSSIIYEQDIKIKHSKIKLTKLTLEIIEKCLNLLAIKSLDKM